MFLFILFSNNSLTSVPSDLCKDMPRLIAVDLGDNQITTVQEESVSPIFQQPLHDLIVAGTAHKYIVLVPNAVVETSLRIIRSPK